MKILTYRRSKKPFWRYYFTLSARYIRFANFAKNNSSTSFWFEIKLSNDFACKIWDMLCSGPFDWPFSVKLKSKSLLLRKHFKNSKNLKPFQFGNIYLDNCVTTYTKPQYLNSRCFCILFCTNYFILHHDICLPNRVYVLRIA